MRRIYLLLVLLLPLSCYNGMNDMYDDLEMKVPICVNSAYGLDTNDGRGWTNAKFSIQGALNSAEDGDVIWVAGAQSIAAPITVNKPVSIYGSFHGSESRRSERDLDNKTDLSIVPTAVALIASGLSDFTFDGFRISGDSGKKGIALSGSRVIIENCDFINNNSSSSPYGAAIWINSASNVKVKNCSFSGNSVSSTGGAIQSEGNSILEIKDCYFQNNTSSKGGAVYVINSDVRISGSTFNNNKTNTSSPVYGGGLYCESSTVVIDDSIFDANYSWTTGDELAIGGGIYFYNCSLVKISNSHFTGNYTNNNNYQMSCGGAIYSESSSLEIDNTEFRANRSSQIAGAIYSYNTSLKAANCIFDSNLAQSITGNGHGGAVVARSLATPNKKHSFDTCTFLSNYAKVYGGAIYAGNYVDVSITNSNFKLNTSDQSGGALYINGASNLNVDRTIITQNTKGAAYSGGGLFHSAGNIQFTNTLFYDNSTMDIFTQASGTQLFYNCTIVNSGNIGQIYSATITNCIMSGTTLTSAGTTITYTGNNLSLAGSTNPAITTSDFADYSSKNFRLSSSSGLINGGIYITGLPSLDLAGNPRIAGGTIDIGAYEYQ